MAKFFLDTNFFMRTYEGLFIEDFRKIATQDIYISILSIHITCYVHKIKLPNKHFEQQLEFFNILPITPTIGQESLTKPTTDYEDNIQLITAYKAGIKNFITLDNDLLKMKSYQGMKIIAPNEL